MAQSGQDGVVEQAEVGQGPSFGELSRVRMSDQVAGALQSAITSGELQSGARLPSENELAVTFNTSRPTVREGLRILEAMGLIEIRSGAGAFVASAPVRDETLDRRLRWLMGRREFVIEILDVRETLQGRAASGCAEAAGADGLLKLQETLEVMKEALATGNSDAFVDADAAFHMEISRLCGNSILADLTTYIEELYRTSNRALIDLRIRHSAADVLAEHRAIVDQIAAHDSAAAAAAMATHIRNVKSSINELAVKST